VAGAERLLEAPGLDGLFITNSVAPPEVLRNHEKLHVIGVEKMFAEAISALDADTKSAVLET
jgi:phosphoribosylpyrophosphate synthetase